MSIHKATGLMKKEVLSKMNRYLPGFAWVKGGVASVWTLRRIVRKARRAASIQFHFKAI